jgi:molybdopterin/thiamine biosynthesis adenylyltransferase
MRDRRLNADAASENAKTLASILKIGAEAATEILDAGIVVAFEKGDASAALLARQTTELLARTVARCGEDVTEPYAAEIVVGDTVRRTARGPAIYVSIDATRLIISRNPTARLRDGEPHPMLSLVAACYVAAAAVKAVVGAGIPHPTPDPLEIDFEEFGVTDALAARPIDIGSTYLAGAGAVGNGFLWTLRHFDVCGELHVVDFDVVTGGNLQRQIWFEDDDIGLPKAERLAARAKPHFPKLRLLPRQYRLQELPERNVTAWLERLVVAVDSRRARRGLQDEMPGAVFDASTTDVSEIVLHFNRQPTQNACLSCVYPPDPAEFAREREIARHLGVSVRDVQTLSVDRNAAEAIAARFPHRSITAAELIGQSYDSLFKALCSEAALTTPEGKRVLAPFAFVSALAGALLAIEFVRRIEGKDGAESFN